MPTSDKIIVVTLHRRYEYTRRVLEALAACDGIADYRIGLHVDPGYPAVEDLAHSFPLPVPPANRKVIIHPRRLGCAGNVRSALAWGFARGDYVIAFEDDTVPAPDCLRMFEACRRFGADATVFTIGAYNRDLPLMADWHRLCRRRWFHPWGWATWQDRWQEMSAQWPTGEAAKGGWNTPITKNVRRDRFEIYPALSRTQNIGAIGGVFCPSPDWHRKNQYNPRWAGALAVTAGQFEERDATSSDGRIEAVVVHYKRPANMPTVVQALRVQSARPFITVIDSCLPGFPLPAECLDVSVLSRENRGCFTRYAKPELYRRQYTYFADDDMVPGDECLASFARVMDENPDIALLGQIGRLAGAGPDAEKVTEAVAPPGQLRDVDALVRGYFVRTEYIVGAHVAARAFGDDPAAGKYPRDDYLALAVGVRLLGGSVCVMGPPTPAARMNGQELPDPFAVHREPDHLTSRAAALRAARAAGWRSLAETGGGLD